MLPGLGHHGFVRRDDEEDRLDSAGAGEHVAHESLVPRHVHEGNPDAVPFGVRKSEVDRDAPALLLGQAVRVDSGERLDERGLPVVDVAGGADEKPLHGAKGIPTPPARAGGE